MPKNMPIVNDLYEISGEIAEATRSGGNPENVKNNSPYKVTSEQLERRYEEYLRARRDLEERVVSLSGKFADEEQQCLERVQQLQNAQNELAAILNAVPEPDSDKFAFQDRAEAASAMRNVEKRRIEAMRVMAAADRDPKTQSNRSDSTEKTLMLLDSITFQQVFRIAFASALPFLFWTLAGASIISLAVIGAWKGWF